MFTATWQIEPASHYERPLQLVFLEQELRAGIWTAHRDKGTVWVSAKRGRAVNVSVFLVRAEGDLSRSLADGGWTHTLVDAALADGRRLLVVAGDALPDPAKFAEVEAFRERARPHITNAANPRMVLITEPSRTMTVAEIAGR